MAKTKHMEIKAKVFHLHPEITPYRLPLFEELSKKVDLYVFFCKTKSKERLWNASAGGYSFRHEVLRSITIGPVIINYLLPFKVLTERYQVFMIDDDPRITLSKIFAFLVAKLRRKTVIIWSEAIDEGYYNKIRDLINRYFLYPIRRLVYHYVDGCVAFGEKTVVFLIQHGVAREKIYGGIQTLPARGFKNSMSKAKKEQLKRTLGFSSKKIIFFVGYLTQRKGARELIKAFKQLDRDDAVLIIAGAGKEEGHLRTLAEGNTHIYFTGYVTEQEKAQYYGIADIFVMPSFVDSWGLVINEAMMSGLPIITTTGAGASTLVQGNGIVVAPGDIKALAQAMGYLLDEDRERKKMGVRSKEIIQDYTIERAAECLTKAIHTVLEKR